MNANSLRLQFALHVKLHVKAAESEQDLPYATVMQHVCASELQLMTLKMQPW